MAFTAREVIMTFRGQNYLSGALRRIGADVGGLSRTSQLATQRAALQMRAAQLNYARSTAQAELSSVATGTRALGVQRARAQLGINERRNVEQIRRIEEQRAGNLIKQSQLQQKINALSAVGSRTKLAPAGQAAEASQTEKALGSQIIAGRGLGRVRVAESLRIAQAEMQRLQHEAQTLNLAFERQQTVIGNSSIAAQQLAAREVELVQREAQLRQSIMARTRAIDENTIAQFRNNYESTKIAPLENWQRRAMMIEHAGRAMQMFGLITTAVMGGAATSAAKFNTQFTLAATQARPPGAGAGTTVRIANQIQQQTMNLMREFPASADEMANSFYEIFSGTNIQGVKQATDAVRVFNQMAVAGGTDLKTMTDAGISLYNNFGGLHGEFKTLSDAGNAFAAAVRYGRMNAEQFANALPNVLGIAKSVGLSFNDIAGAMATLTRQTGGKFTSRDATGIARMIEIFARPDFVSGAKKFGVAIKDTQGNMRPLLDIINEFAAKTRGKDRVDLLSLFKTISGAGSSSGHGGTAGTIQARRAFQYLITDIGNYRLVSGKVREDNNELQRSFEAMSKTPGIRWQVFINQIRVLIYEIGTQAIPVFIELGKPLAKAVTWFDNLNQSTKRWIATVATFASVGTLIIGVAAGIAGALARVSTQFVLTRRTANLEKEMASMRAISEMQTALPPPGATTAIINPRTGSAFSRTNEAEQETQRRSRLMEEQGSARLGAGIGLAGLIAVPALMQSSRGFDHLINKLGGTTTAILTLVGVMNGQLIKSFIQAGVQGVAAAVRVSAAWITSNTRSALSFAGLRAAGIGTADAVATANVVAADATKIAWRTALASTGWGLLILGVSFAVSYILTHWSQVEKYFRRFWLFMKAIFAAGWQVIVQGGKAAAYEIVAYATAGLRAILKAASYVPGIRGEAKKAQADINHILNNLKPNMGAIGQAYTQVYRNDAIARANRANDERSANAQNNRWKAIAEYWNQRNKASHAATRTTNRNAALDNAAGVAPNQSMSKTVQGWIQYIERARKASLGSPGDLQKALAYENAQAALNKRFKDQPQLLAAINDVLQNYSSSADKAQNATDRLANKMTASFESVLSGIQQRYQTFLGQEQGIMGDLFKGPFVSHLDKFEFGGRLTPADLTRDATSQINQFRKFHANLRELARRGAPASLLKSLMEMGPAANDAIKAMLQMNQPQMKRYFAMIKDQQKLIHDATMRDLNSQLSDYLKYGRNAALQILAGFKDENVGVTRSLKHLIKRMFGSIPTEAEIAAKQAAKQVTTAVTNAANNAAGASPGGRRAVSRATGTPSTADVVRTVRNTRATKLDPSQLVSNMGRTNRDRPHPPRGAGVTGASPGQAWNANLNRLTRVMNEFGRFDPNRVTMQVLQSPHYLQMYRDVVKEVKREMRSQGLRVPGDKALERLIWRQLHIRPAPGWDSQRRNTQNARTTEQHTHYHIVAPKSEQATVKAQVRHADFIIRSKHKPSR